MQLLGNYKSLWKLNGSQFAIVNNMLSAQTKTLVDNCRPINNGYFLPIVSDCLHFRVPPLFSDKVPSEFQIDHFRYPTFHFRYLDFIPEFHEFKSGVQRRSKLSVGCSKLIKTLLVGRRPNKKVRENSCDVEFYAKKSLLQLILME